MPSPITKAKCNSCAQVSEYFKSYSGYVPFWNNEQSVYDSVQSLLQQQPVLDDVFALDDGSTDGSLEQLERLGVRCLRSSGNFGRGAARHRAMLVAAGDLVVCCDATNILLPDFFRRLRPWFYEPNVAAVYGLIQDPHPQGVVGRWRARHLFKSGHPLEVRHYSPLITYGTIIRRSAVLEVGNFNPQLRHSEDSELGERLLAAGYDIVFDPSVPVYCNVQNTLFQVLERYWRWYAGKEENVSLGGYWRTVVYSIKGMAWLDLRAGDPLAALVSLLCPHYQIFKSFWRRLRSQDVPDQSMRSQPK